MRSGAWHLIVMTVMDDNLWRSMGEGSGRLHDFKIFCVSAYAHYVRTLIIGFIVFIRQIWHDRGPRGIGVMSTQNYRRLIHGALMAFQFERG